MVRTLRHDPEAGFSGLHKTSILMLALGEAYAAKLFALMHEDEIKGISATMAQLGQRTASHRSWRRSGAPQAVQCGTNWVTLTKTF